LLAESAESALLKPQKMIHLLQVFGFVEFDKPTPHVFLAPSRPRSRDDLWRWQGTRLGGAERSAAGTRVLFFIKTSFTQNTENVE
jgi:hypothetical protein